MRALLCAALITAALPAFADNASVYKPRVQANGLKDIKSAGTQHGMLGAAYANTLTTGNEIQAGLLLNGRYFAGDRWYLLGEFQYGEFNSEDLSDGDTLVIEEGEDALRYAFGAGYSVLQGNASTSGQYAVPWSIAAELAVGEQTTGDTSGQYTSLGLSVQFHGPKVWTAVGARQFVISDERLEQVGADRGMQWDISLGMWF
ncbi:hypothetical protein [uncultured Thalassolituus sp.]|uniref:hypothetical protein n=1 Tax=Thalassolituus sp. TaxID=2030822 RepID=UPI002603F194|nr:hypothetical protein [uncultured Thalassolituus sp.]